MINQETHCLSPMAAPPDPAVPPSGGGAIAGWQGLGVQVLHACEEISPERPLLDAEERALIRTYSGLGSVKQSLLPSPSVLSAQIFPP